MLESLLIYDIALFERLNGIHSPFWDTVFHSITQLGNGWVSGPILIAIICYISPRQSLKRILLISAVILLTCGLLNSVLKKTIRRPRPLRYYRQVETNFKVHVVGKRLASPRSFPSGHTLTVFSAAALLAALYGGLFNLTFILALLAGYSRIYVGVHFPLDVVAGAFLAVAYTFAGVRLTGIHRIARSNTGSTLKDTA